MLFLISVTVSSNLIEETIFLRKPTLMDLFSSFTKTSQTFATRTKTKLNTNQIETATKNKLQSTLEAFNRRRRHIVGIEKDYESKKIHRLNYKISLRDTSMQKDSMDTTVRGTIIKSTGVFYHFFGHEKFRNNSVCYKKLSNFNLFKVGKIQFIDNVIFIGNATQFHPLWKIYNTSKTKKKLSPMKVSITQTKILRQNEAIWKTNDGRWELFLLEESVRPKKNTGRIEDLSLWYSNNCVVLTVETMQEMIEFYHNKSKTMLRLGCTLPFLGNVCLHNLTEAKPNSFEQSHEDFFP